MANRTFKVKGVGYDSGGSVNVVLSIAGNEVFNGAVTVGTTNVYGTDMTEGELFTFQLDDSVTGDVAWQMSMTGTDHTSKMWLSGMQANLTKNNMIVDNDYWEGKIAAMTGDIATQSHTLSDQQAAATAIGKTRLDAQKTGVYEKLMAGTATIGADGYYVVLANESEGGKQTDWYSDCAWTLSNGVRDGESYDVTGAGHWPLIKSGSTLNMTVGLGITNYEYNPPNTHPDDL